MGRLVPYLVPLGLDEFALAGPEGVPEDDIEVLFAQRVFGKFTLVVTNDELRRLRTRSGAGDSVSHLLRRILETNPIRVTPRSALIERPVDGDPDPSAVVTLSGRLDAWGARDPKPPVADVRTFLLSDELNSGTDSVRTVDDGFRSINGITRAELWSFFLGPVMNGRNVRICDYVIANDVVASARTNWQRTSGTEYVFGRLNELCRAGSGPVNVHVLTREPGDKGVSTADRAEVESAFQDLTKRLGLKFRTYVKVCPQRTPKGVKPYPYSRFVVTGEGTLNVRLLQMSSSLITDCKMKNLPQRRFEMFLTSNRQTINDALQDWRMDADRKAYLFEVPPSA